MPKNGRKGKTLNAQDNMKKRVSLSQLSLPVVRKLQQVPFTCMTSDVFVENDTLGGEKN